MATLKQKIAAEQKMRELIETEGLPEPSGVEYRYTCIRFFWDESKIALVIEIDKPPEGFETVGEYLEDISELSERLDVDDAA